MIIKEFDVEKVVNDDIKGKRKINVRFEYLTKMCAAYRKVRAKHYVKQAEKIKEDKYTYVSDETREAERQDALNKANKHAQKYEEHKARLREIDEIKKERALEKSKTESEVDFDALSDDLKDNQQNELEKNTQDVMKDIQNTLATDVQNIQASEAVEDIQSTLATGVQDIQVSESIAPEDVTINHVEEPAPEISSNVQEDAVEVVQNDDIPNVVEDNNQDVQVSESVGPEDVTINHVEESAPEIASNVQEDTVEVTENNDAKDVNAMLDRFEKYNQKFSIDWQSSMQSIFNVVRDYTTTVQRDSVEALTNKQLELNTQKRENDKLSKENKELNKAKNELNLDLVDTQEKVAKLEKGNSEKDTRIQELTLENQKKDKEIDDLTALYNNQRNQTELYEKENEELKRSVEAMSQQFKQMQQMFNSLQAVMQPTEMQSVSSISEDSVQKVK